jgi:putative flippase GtrA
MGTKTPLGALLHRARIGQFVSVGAVGAAIETAVVAALTAGVGVGPLAAKAVGAELSISTMFLVNDRWTFAAAREPGVVRTGRRWLKSHMVRAVGLGVAFLTLFVLTSGLTVSVPVAGVDLWPTIANGIGIGAGLGINYVAESLFTWRVAAS